MVAIWLKWYDESEIEACEYVNLVSYTAMCPIKLDRLCYSKVVFANSLRAV